MSQMNSEIEAEVHALDTVLTTLAPLDNDTRRRVLLYVQHRFGINIGEQPFSTPIEPPPSTGLEAPDASGVTDTITDIRTLKGLKQPHSAIQMAVLVSYYISEVAPQSERKGTIGTSDINKYFKQAGYPLPGQPSVILHKAKDAGYLDSASRGQYSLNPVGHNLVVHGLPRPSTAKRSSVPRTTKSKPTPKKKRPVRPKG